MTGTAWRGMVVSVLAFLIGCGPSASAPAPKQAAAPAAPAAPAAAPAQTTAASPALQALIDGARREGQLNLVWGDSSIGGEEGIRRMVQGFNQAYGLNVNVRFTPGPAMPEMAMKVLQEHAANRPASTDVLLATETQFA